MPRNFAQNHKRFKYKILSFFKSIFLKKMVIEKTPNFLSKRVQTHKQSLNNMYNSFLIDSHII